MDYPLLFLFSCDDQVAPSYSDDDGWAVHGVSYDSEIKKMRRKKVSLFAMLSVQERDNKRYRVSVSKNCRLSVFHLNSHIPSLLYSALYCVGDRTDRWRKSHMDLHIQLIRSAYTENFKIKIISQYKGGKDILFPDHKQMRLFASVLVDCVSDMGFMFMASREFSVPTVKGGDPITGLHWNVCSSQE